VRASHRAAAASTFGVATIGNCKLRVHTHCFIEHARLNLNVIFDGMPADPSRAFVRIQILQNGPMPIVRNPIIRSQHLDVTVNEFCCFGAITIRFRNPFDEPVEMLFSFPLLDGGAVVTGIKTEWDGQVIEGMVRDSKKGKEEYKAALSKGHTASLCEHGNHPPPPFSYSCSS
jgi:hypothetical protein